MELNNNANIKYSNKHSFYLYRSNVIINIGSNVNNKFLYDFFVTACESTFFQQGDHAKKIENELNWWSKNPLNMHIWLSSDKKETTINIKSGMFSHFYGFKLGFYYILLFQLTQIFGRFFNLKSFEPLYFPARYHMLDITLKIIMIIIILIGHFYIRAKRIYQFKNSFDKLVLSIKNFLEINKNKQKNLKDKIISLIPEVEKPCVYEIFKRIMLKLKINQFNKDKTKSILKKAGFAEVAFYKLIDIETLKSIGYNYCTGNKIKITAIPKKDGTELIFWSDLIGFVPIIALFTFIGLTLVESLIITYTYVIKFGSPGITPKLLSINIYLSVIIVSIIKKIIISSRNNTIANGTKKLVNLLYQLEKEKNNIKIL